MNVFQRIRAMLVYAWRQLSGKGDAQYQPKPATKRAAATPTAKPEPAEKTPKVDKGDPDYPIASASTWMQLYEQNAEAWENDQRKYVAALEQYGRTGAAEAIMALDWAKVMRKYTPRTIDMVFFDGTKLSLGGRPETHKVISAAAREARKQLTKGVKAPKGHGMDKTGKQK